MMNRTSLIVGIILGEFLLLLTGCHSSGEKKQLTDWSIPSVKLVPHSKDEEVVLPASKANVQSTASLAHDRLKGHNPTAAIRDSEDATLRPDPQEVAALGRFEGKQTPEWATGLPQGPDASEPAAAERIAKNIEVTDSSSGSLTPSASETPALVAEPNAVAAVPVNTNETLPSSLELPSEPSQPTSQILENTVAAQPAPTAQVPLGGDSMMELPGTVQQVSATIPASTPATNPAVIPASVPATASSQTSTPAVNTAQPAALFMPGNINPNYPNR